MIRPRAGRPAEGNCVSSTSTAKPSSGQRASSEFAGSHRARLLAEHTVLGFGSCCDHLGSFGDLDPSGDALVEWPHEVAARFIQGEVARIPFRAPPPLARCVVEDADDCRIAPGEHAHDSP
jgi:hypothetical protein